MPTPLAERDVPSLSNAQHFIGDRAVAGEGKRFDVTFPVTGEQLITLQQASLDQVDAAVGAARQAFEAGDWRRMPAGKRAAVLERTGDLLAERKSELVHRILFDNAKTRGEAEIDVLAAIGACRANAHYARDDAAVKPPSELGIDKLVVREPVGVVAALTPFNAPLMFSAVKAAPALAAGNSVVLKPSERAPLLAIALCEAASEAGMPPGVLQLVHGGAEVAAALCGHPQVDMITLTGGNRAGTEVMRAAAPAAKNVLLELGGKSAHIVLADADLERAVPAVAAGIFRNSGQRCFSGSRLVVEASVAERVEAEIAEIADSLRVGDPFEDTTQVGAMIDEAAVDAVASFVERARHDGLTVAAGGQRPEELQPGSFYRPTVLIGARSGDHACQTELFGPVLTVVRVNDADEAVRVANDSRYGLAGGVWSQDLDKAQRVARAVRTGYMWVNTYAAVFGDVPFGGYGQSGVGREGGRHGYEAYTEIKTVLVDTTGGTTAPVFD